MCSVLNFAANQAALTLALLGKIGMSRIGKKPIEIPEGVEVKIEGQRFMAKGSRGELSLKVRPEMKIEIKENKIFISPSRDLGKKNKYLLSKKDSAFWGLTRALIFNIIEGVKKGYEKKLEIEGVGFRASVDGKILELKLGFSHPVKIEASEGINFKVEKNIITVSGIDKQKVGEMAAKIRKVRPPDPYKGKGIKYFGEIIRKKAGKKAVATTT